MRRVVFLLAVLALAGAVSASAPATRGTRVGVVTAARSGDTLEVRVGGRTQTVRVLGVVAPRVEACHGDEALAFTRSVALGKRVLLVTDPSSRTASYVTLPGGVDLGRTLLSRGHAQLAAWTRPFARFAPYLPVERKAEAAGRGLWRHCSADVTTSIETAAEFGVLSRELVYTVAVTNIDASTASRVVVDLRPSAARIVSAKSASGSCALRGWYASCSLGALGGSSTATVTLTVLPTRAGTLSTRAVARFDSCIRGDCGTRAVRDPNFRNNETAALTTVLEREPEPGKPAQVTCDSHYPTICIPPPPPDLDCADIPYRNFYVPRGIPDPDPHRLDNSEDGIGCQFDDY